MKIKKIVLILSFVLSTAVVSAEVNYDNPTIDSVLRSGGGSESTGSLPNVYLTLDNSGSMHNITSGEGQMPWDNSKDYPPPPNPKTLAPYPEPSGNQNGFEEHGYKYNYKSSTKKDRNHHNGYHPVKGGSFKNGAYANSALCDVSKAGQKCKNFKAFYGSRMLALQSTLARALVDSKPKMRLRYQFLNQSYLNFNVDDLEGNEAGDLGKIYPADGSFLNIDPTTAAYQKNMESFLDWLYRRVANGRTPTRERMQGITEGMYEGGKLKANILDGDQCRQTFSIVLSDGVWNAIDNVDGEANPGSWTPLAGDYDARQWTWELEDSNKQKQTVHFDGSGKQQQQRLFAGGNPSKFRGYDHTYALGGGLADIALWQWATDLDGDSQNNVIPPYYAQAETANQAEFWNPKNDPATWQRIVTYTIGLGIGTEWTNECLASHLSKGPASPCKPTGQVDGIEPSWPWINDEKNDTSTFQKGHIQDFVRAGYVGRGGFYRVDSPSELSMAFEAIFKDIETRSTLTQTTGGSVSSAQVTAASNSIMLTAQSDYENRSGTVKANWLYNGRPANSSKTQPGDADKCFASGQAGVDNFVGQMCDAATAKWSAADKMPDWEDREIYTIKEDGTGITFEWDELSEAQQTVLNGLGTPIKGEALVEYLKGKPTAVPGVRQREGKILGDIGHSTPIFVGNPDNRVWQAAEQPTRLPMVYVGANDGMLHAFDAKTGVEKFAYFPNLLLEKIDNLVKAGQQHQGFVDGQLAVADIVNPADGSEMTLLVSGLGSGGKGLFALDVSDPDDFDEEDVLWELSDSRLGKVMGKPSIIRVEGTYKGRAATAQKDRWVVVVGTGYGNGGGNSGVLVIDAISGEVLQFLALPGSAGVGEIAWIDHQKYPAVNQRSVAYLSDDGYMGEMDRGYVGDLKGQLWILDFAYDKSKTETTLRSGLTLGGEAKPLFTATDKNNKPQQITSGLVTAPHPSNRGIMIYFGTGELFASNPMTTVQNSMYGIWDDFGENYGNIATADVETYNKPRTRNFLAYYPWQQKTGVFADNTKAYYRQIGADTISDISLTGVVKNPITWANTGPYGDSVSVDPSSYTVATVVKASGWVFDAKVGERISQKPYSIVNERGESGITFLLYSKSTEDGQTVTTDACGGGEPAGFYTWNMSMRTDIIDGPATPFSFAHTDSSQDGTIDNNDAVKSSEQSTETVIPMGAVSGKTELENSAAGEKGLISPPIITGSLGVSSGACLGGDIRTYKKVDENGNATEVRICIPRTASAYSEIE